MAKTPEQMMQEILNRKVSGSGSTKLLSETAPQYKPQLTAPTKTETPKKGVTVKTPRGTTVLEDIGQYIEDRPMLQGALNVLGAPFGAVNTQLVNWMDQDLNWKDIPLAEPAQQFVQGVAEYGKEKLEENPLMLPFAPIAGLANVGAQAKTGADIAKSSYALGSRLRGVDQETSKRLAEEMAQKYPKTTMGLGLTYDILGPDPLNKVTFGAGSVTKAGARAAQKTAQDIAKDIGVTATRGREAQEVPELVYQKTLQKYQQNPKNLNVLAQQPQRAVASPDEIAKQVERITNQAIKRGVAPDKAADLASKAVKQGQQPAEIASRAEQLAQQARKATQKQIEDAAKAARLESQNAMISLDIPFTNITKTLVKKPARFRKTAEGTGEVGERIVAGLFVPPPDLKGDALVKFNDKVSNFLFDVYGTRKASDLTVEEIRDLQRRFEQAGGRDVSKTFGLETVKKTKEVPDIQTTDVSKPFIFDEFIKNYSPEVQNLSRQLLREGMTPEEIIAQLPDLMRRTAETAKQKTVIPPTMKPLPKNIGDKLDELFYFSQLAGKPTATYEEGFKQILDLYNRPDVPEQNIVDFLDEAIAEAKRPLEQAEATRVAQQTKQAEQIASENARLQKEYDDALVKYNEAKSTYQARKKEARTQAQKERLKEYERRLKAYENTLAEIKAKQKAQAKVKVSTPAPKAPAPAPKLTPFEQAKAKNLADDDALLVDEYAHYLKVSGLTDEAIAQKVTSFATSLSKNPDAMRKELARLIAEQKKKLSSNMPTGKKVLELVKDQPQNIWKPLLDKIKSPEIANLIQEILLREVGMMVKSGVKKGESFRVATFGVLENGKGAFLTRREKLIDDVVGALDNGASEADILAQLKAVKNNLFNKSMSSKNADQIRELVKERGKAVQEVDELKPVLPKGMEYKPPTGVAPKVAEEAPAPAPTDIAPKNVDEAFEERLLADTTPLPNSREKIIYMKIDDFLKMAAPLEKPTKKTASEILQSGGKFNSIPFLEYKNDANGVAKVSGHEGRHRALALKDAGYTEMPVKIVSPDIRWSEQLDTTSRDYVANFPKTLKGQEDNAVNEIAFPIKREDAPNPAKAPTPKPEPTVAEKISEVLKPKRGEGLTFKKPAKVVKEAVPTKPQPKRGKGLVFKKPEKIVEKIAEDLKPQPKRGEGLKFKPPVKEVEAPPKPQPKRGEGLKFKPPEKPLIEPKAKGVDGFSPNLSQAIDDGMSRWGYDLSDYFGENRYAPIINASKEGRYGEQYVDFDNVDDAKRYWHIFENGSANDEKYFIHQEGSRVYMFPRDGKELNEAFKSAFPKEYMKSRMARLSQPKLKYKAPEENITSNTKAYKTAPQSLRDLVDRNFTKSSRLIYHNNGIGLVQTYDTYGRPMFSAVKDRFGNTRVDVEQYTGKDFTPEQLRELIAVKEKWFKDFEKANANDINTPFAKGEKFSASKNVPKNIADITAQWADMLGLKGKLHLTTKEDGITSNFSGKYVTTRNHAENTQLGMLVTHQDGTFIIIYDPKKGINATLEAISHELGHAVMFNHYNSAPADVQKAIDDEYQKWLDSTKGKSNTEIMRSMRNRKVGKISKVSDNIVLPNYWTSKDEWFADQVSRWATTSEKPVSVVEKFFARLAKVMKQFFQMNKQYLPSKTMEDWLNGLVKAGQEEKTQQLKQTFGDVDVSTSGSKIDLKLNNIDIELPKRPTKKDIPLVIEQIEEAIKPKRPVLAKVPKVEPPKAIELPKEKRAELRKMREAMQPSAEPRIIKGLDAKFANEMKRAATKLENQKPVKVETLKEPKGTMQIEEVRTKKGAKPIRAENVPFHRLRQEGAFQRDAGGVSAVGKVLRDSALFRMFNARSLGTGNSFLDSYGGMIQDASTRISGETRFIRRDLVAIQKAAEGLTPEQMLGVQYVIENRFPKNMSEADQQAILGNAKVQQVAELSKKLLAYLGAEERTAGILKNLRKDYFPHLLKFNAQDAEEFAKRYRNDPDLRDLAKGLSQKAGFSMERRGLPTLAEYDDKLLELETKMNQADSPSIRDDYMRKINALQDLFNRDTVNALSSRVYQSVRSRAMKDLYDQMKTDGMIRYGKTVPKGYTALSPKQAGLLGIDKRTAEGGVSMSDEVLRGLEKVEGFFKDENMNGFVKTLDDLTRLWKLGTTMLIPRHYVNNLIGNAFNNGLAGVKIDSYVEATKKMQTIAKKKIDDMTPAEREEIVQLYRDGVIGQGINAEFRTAEQLAERSILQRMSDWAQKTWYGRNVMYIGEMVDDWSRLALYLHAKKVTNSHKMAVDTVRKYLFNYHELTQADRFIRSTMMPFWLWMKHNIPLQFQQVLRQPRYYVTAEKIRQATFEDDELSEQPDYIREKGFKLFGQTYAINLPMYDLYVINGVQGTAKNIINMFGPLQTFLPEIVTNKDVFTEAPISRDLSRGKQEDYSTSDIAKYLTRQFGGAIGSDLLELYKNVFEEERLTGAEQAKRSTLGFFLPKPALQE